MDSIDSMYYLLYKQIKQIKLKQKQMKILNQILNEPVEEKIIIVSNKKIKP